MTAVHTHMRTARISSGAIPGVGSGLHHPYQAGVSRTSEYQDAWSGLHDVFTDRHNSSKCPWKSFGAIKRFFYSTMIPHVCLCRPRGPANEHTHELSTSDYMIVHPTSRPRVRSSSYSTLRIRRPVCFLVEEFFTQIEVISKYRPSVQTNPTT